MTLEKGSGAEGARFRVKSVSIEGFASEKAARAAYNRLIPKKANSVSDLDADGAGGYTSPTNDHQTPKKRC